MKKIPLCILIWFLVCPTILHAEDFLGAPVIPGAETVSKTESHLEMKVPMNHDKILAFYREALKGYNNIKYRNWKESTYIEDDGNRPWHSINISKEEKGGTTTVVIVKDNWTWIIGTLALRFFGVFMVLIVILVSISVSGAIISRSIARMEAKKAQAKT